MSAHFSLPACEVVNLSAYRAQPRREDMIEHRTVALTAEAWRVLEQMTEDAAVGARLTAMECDRELDAGAARKAEEEAEWFEGVLTAIRRCVF